MASDYTFNTRGIDQLMKALKGNNKEFVALGILGEKTHRDESKKKLTYSEVTRMKKPHTKSGITNAELGKIHEYGSPSRGIPPRSFLRMPTNTRLPKALKQAGAFEPVAFKEVLKHAKLTPWLEKVGAMAFALVKEAFASGGFGTWQGWKGNYTNNTGMLLQDTTQMRDAVTYEVRTA